MNRKTIFLLLVSILITLSCKKKFVNNPSNNSILKTFVSIDTIRGLEKVGSILKFETVDDYADFIEDTNQVKWAKLLQFTSEKGFQNFFVQHPITNFEDLNAMDENFGQLLNSDGVIIIGNDALKIDLPKKKVYLTALEGLSPNYQSLIIGDTVNKSIHSFSTDDDIIDYLLYGIIEKCGGSDDFNEVSNNIYPFENNTLEYLTWNARYFKAGIYFSVKIKALHTYISFIWADYSKVKFEVKIAPSPSWKAMRMKPRPCSGNNNVSHHGGIRSFTGFGSLGSATNPATRLFSAYERVRGLNGYRVWIRGIYVNSLSDTITTNSWIGREVNSNF
jgi:hypothetical protein